MMRSATPCRAALRAATSSAVADTSVATTRHDGASHANVTAMLPEPVPRSATSAAGCAASSGSAASMMCSVSGRGISTAGLTSKSRP